MVCISSFFRDVLEFELMQMFWKRNLTLNLLTSKTDCENERQFK